MGKYFTGYLLGSVLTAICTTTWAASDITGKVHTINVNKTWGGIFIQLDNAQIFEPGSSCAINWAFMPISDEYTKHFMAIAMSSKATGETIRIATNGCMSTPPGPVPKIEWIDYGIRN